MFASPWIAALSALFLWWFSTGAILCVVKHADRRNEPAHLAVVLFGLPVLAAGIVGFWASLGLETVWGSYLGFISALAVWGWIELAFLTGVITGPNTMDCPDDIPEWQRFIRAWGTIAYHEMLLIAALLAMAWAAYDAANGFGFWTFAVLFFARISAKLNLYLGVRKINTEFLPKPLGHLPSHFRIARLNWLFPISVTGLTFAVACWLERLYSASTAHDIAGFALLSAITALALFEHWLMVLPLPDEKLWQWMLPKTNKNTLTTQRTAQ
ncbi:putative photosynthetic complex assembly protein PuhE [Pseudaestuariivita rosea]|uniref:putative photosynthetic complex assembly protein PuhE n=1 Tax=Pseudaestuariivita rosea TaxID=2763263 RepID=UPI001ABAFD9F|nr:putative photosynthetic complex assembly protein PuhE [Pseudaestuariivita rosea]